VAFGQRQYIAGVASTRPRQGIEAGDRLLSRQGPAEIEQTEEAARETFTLLRDGWSNGTLEQMLECELRQESFRRLVS